MKFQPNSLYYGDCLDVMKEWPDSLVDLCYLDPPFNSKASYNILFGKNGGGGDSVRPQIIAFEDTWHWDETAQNRVDQIKRAVLHPAHTTIKGLHVVLGDCGMMAYLSYMVERLAEIKRVLKKNGSVYLHCDPTASHYLKVVMDGIFGKRNFRNEVAWCYKGPSNTKKWFPKKHDTIFFYTKSDDWIFNPIKVPYSESFMVRRRYTEGTSGITAGYSKGRSVREVSASFGEGKLVEDYWTDIGAGGHIPRSELMGYPTQKPIALLERIIGASSREGDVVLDPFCGCGTTVDAAHRLNRRYVGIDISPIAVGLVKNKRLKDDSVPVHGIPLRLQDAKSMASKRPFDFEKWAISRIPGMAPNSKQVADRGIDGRGNLLNDANGGKKLVLAQVKGGKFSLSHLRDFRHVVHRERAAMGIYITLDRVTSRHARAEAEEAGTFKLGVSAYPRVQMWSIADYFDNRQPKLPPLVDPYTGKEIQTDMFAPP